ncbi:MAG: RNA polymerase sigma factor [Woeseiaceae bacterium]|nr:RNA polymerase sigma factor [Woeseiaceae bacterium]
MTALSLANMEHASGMMPATTDNDERSLVARIADARDVAAFERLYHDYRRRLGPFVYRMIRDASANDEVFNDVMLAVWRNAASFTGKSKVSTWVFGIAYRQCLKHLRGRKPTVELDDSMHDSVDDRQSFERQDLVVHAIAGLSPEQRLVIELSYFQGNTYSEIAEIAGCPENTIKTRVFHARRRLKAIMAELGERAPAEEQ